MGAWRGERRPSAAVLALHRIPDGELGQWPDREGCGGGTRGRGDGAAARVALGRIETTTLDAGLY